LRVAFCVGTAGSISAAPALDGWDSAVSSY
jgi:hypothetical protein